MILEIQANIRKKIKRVNGKEYTAYFISFPTKYTPILSEFEELHSVEILTKNNRIILPRAKLIVLSYYYKNNEKIPIFSITIPKQFAEELLSKGEKKLRIIVELPDLTVKS